jgi:hypothetical protein
MLSPKHSGQCILSIDRRGHRKLICDPTRKLGSRSVASMIVSIIVSMIVSMIVSIVISIVTALAACE